MQSSPFDQPYAGGFLGAEHRFALTVYFEDTDVGGVVYHANYLRYFERARSDMLRAVGIDQRAAQEAGEGVYAVSAMDIRFVRPARLGDALVVASRVQAVRGASCVIQQRVIRNGDEVARAMVTVAFLSPDGRPRRQPKHWVDAFERLIDQESPSA